MNYRHAFHAGNFADVIKHIILTRIICYMQKKDKGFRVLDTHAGIGLYDLTSDEAQRSPEWKNGIQALMNAKRSKALDELIKPYLDMVESLNTSGTLKLYPGSPLLARKLLREQDRLTATELHPRDAIKLKSHFEGDIQVKAIELDGWQALVAHMPPKEKRGIVLVDPPFEKPDEFTRMGSGLFRAHKRFSTGTYMLWYPIKDVAQKEVFATQLYNTGIKKVLRVEFNIHQPTFPPTLHGTGMIIVNPPFTLVEELKLILAELQPILAPSGKGDFKIDWIYNED
jgi:23S rRNA (adenine2030-N6)-methyltransferase